MTVALSFDDGVSGTVDLSTWIGGRGGVFAPLHDPAYFASVTLDEDAGTIVWPNGVDLDPRMLYDAVRGSTQRLSA
ncbi:MAG: DUF2442 domain-containing protein [Gemmatimonadaceae bacterium]|nr:DUF2442 domain-containing protein [Gemmatimonadaceae bacterium]